MKVFVLARVDQIDYEETKAIDIYESILAVPLIFSTLIGALQQAAIEHSELIEYEEELAELDWVKDGTSIEASISYMNTSWRITEVEVLEEE